jgi:hypothetical protein
VSDAEANAFVKKLTDVHEWTCAETDRGGVVSYRARDKKGHWYFVIIDSPGGTSVERATAP